MPLSRLDIGSDQDELDDNTTIRVKEFNFQYHKYESFTPEYEEQMNYLLLNALEWILSYDRGGLEEHDIDDELDDFLGELEDKDFDLLIQYKKPSITFDEYIEAKEIDMAKNDIDCVKLEYNIHINKDVLLGLLNDLLYDVD